MEDKKLNSQESIDLISRMIRNTQNNLQKNAGIHSLIWGYTSLAAALAVYFTLKATGGNLHSHLLWMSIPVIGLLLELTLGRRGRTTNVRTFVDSATSKLWIPLGAALLTFPFLTTGMDTLSLVLMLIGLGIAQTGLIAKYPLFTVAGFVGLAAALALFFIGGNGKILIFAFFIVVVLIIPGHILNHKAAKDHVQGA